MAAGDVITTAKFINIKARVKAEVLRRNGYGSLTSYGGTSYDYATAPATGNPPIEEHIRKIQDPMQAISTVSIPVDRSAGDLITWDDLNLLDVRLTANEATPRGSYSPSGTGDCASSCSGMCVTQCTTSCIGGCTGSCSGCTGTCTGTCTGSCTAACATGCTGSCSGTCTGSCTDAC
ncbi:MAG: hypothetical protein EOM11_09525, partial [Erysipelotrichia bacterium]|nr:hypothetical protein [Erysipelotrichia bacterium]